MPYIGNSPANVGNYQIVDDISGSFNGSTTSFALATAGTTITPAKSGQLLVGVNGVMQEPDDTSTNGFKVSGSNIVFSSAPASGDTFWAVYQGQSVDIGTPSDDVVDTIHIKDNAITADKIAAGAVVADVADDSITNAMMADNAIDSAQITSGAVDDAHIADVAATKLTGTIADARFPATLPTASATNLTSIPAGNLTGTIAAARLSTATTQSASDNSTKIATTAYADAQVATVVDSAPSTLDTLNELAEALGDDANFSTTVTTSIGTKLPKAGGEMSGNITMASTETVDGRDLSVDGAKLDLIAASANNYSHPTSAGNKHIPSGGSSGQFLKYTSAGTAVWAADNDTTYSVGDGGLTANDFTNTLKTKLDGVEASADVTDTTNVVDALTAGDKITIANDGTVSFTITEFPFYKADGNVDNITITNGEFPFYKADGNQDNIGVT